jgi:putative ABC transport system substrate-binding protein
MRLALLAAEASGMKWPASLELQFISYGIDSLDLYGRAASYVDRILRGAKVAELPVQQPTKVELVSNLKTAKTLGLNTPSTLLARASEVH